MSDNPNDMPPEAVLSSIRQIVTAENGAGGGDVAVQTRAADESPLALTPDMRTATPSMPGIGAGPAEVAAPPPTTKVLDARVLRETIREVVREELASPDGERLVRQIIRAELTAGETGGNISRNVLRLIRAEINKALSS